jgi:hypothetical protein
MVDLQEIKVARDFTEAPGGRFYSDGDWSGEKFREEFLWPALTKYGRVRVDLAGTQGYGSSFLEEAFGGIVRKHQHEMKDIASRIELIPAASVYVKEAFSYLHDAGTGGHTAVA